VQVRVDLASLTAAGAGHTEPGLLERLDEVTATTARRLATQAIAAGGRIERLVTHPLTGRLLDCSLIPRGGAPGNPDQPVRPDRRGTPRT
jgi:hypothetical protein